MWLWRRHGFEQRLLDELQRQQRRSLFCDTLLQADGISVPAHGCVLAALSPALAQVLCSGPAPPPGRSRLLELQAVGAEPLLRLVGFLYSGQLQGEGPAEREELLQAAARLGIHGLLEEEEEEEDEEEGGRRGEGEDGPGTDRGHADKQHHTPPRPPTGHAPRPTMQSEGSDDYFALSSSAAPGLAGISPAKRAPTPAAVAMQTAHSGPAQPAGLAVAQSDDVMAAPPMGCASAPAALATGGPGSPPSAQSHSPATKRRGGAVLGRGGRATRGRGGGGVDQHARRERRGGLNPGSLEEGKVARMRSCRMKGRGRPAHLRTRPRDRRISFKIRLRRQCKGKLWEIVSMREEGVASTNKGRRSQGRGRGLRHLQNLPTLGRIIRSKDGLPVVKRPRRLTRAPPQPQRIFSALTLSPPSALSSPPTLPPVSPPPPQKPHPLLHTCPAREPEQPLPPAPPIAEDSDEQIERLLDDIMMGLNILPPVVVGTDAGGHGDGGNLDRSGSCAYQCPQITESPRPETGLLCPRTQDGPSPTDRQSRYMSSQETTFPRLPQQASDELHILDHILWSRGSDGDGAWERSAAGRSDGGGAVAPGDRAVASMDEPTTYSLPQQSGVALATGALSQGSFVPASQSRSTAVTLGQASSPWRELQVPAFLSPPPPVTPRLNELRLPPRLSPLGMGAAPPSAPPNCPTDNSAPPNCPTDNSAPPNCPIDNSTSPNCPTNNSAPPYCPTNNSAAPNCPTDNSAHLNCPTENSAPPTCPRGSSARPVSPPPPAPGAALSPPLPPWLCPFPVPLRHLTSPLSPALQAPACPCPPQRGSPKTAAAAGGGARAEEEAGRRKAAPRGRSVRLRKGGKEAKPAAACGPGRRAGPHSDGRGRGGAGGGGGARHCTAPLRNSYVCAGKTPRPPGCAETLRQSDRSARKPKALCICADAVETSAVCAGGVKQEGVCLQSVRAPLICAGGPQEPPKRGRGRPRKRRREAEAAGPALAPAGGSQVGELGHEPAGKRRSVTNHSRGLSLTTRSSSACWEGDPGAPSPVAQPSDVHAAEGEDEGGGERGGEVDEPKRGRAPAGGLEGCGPGAMGQGGVITAEERGMEGGITDPEPEGESTDRAVEPEAEEERGAGGMEGMSGGGGRRKNYEDEFGGGTMEDQATPISVGGEDQATPISVGGVDQATPITVGGEDQATPISVGGVDQAMPITVGGKDQATPITVGGEDQATPITVGGEDQATPITVGGEDQATPITVGGEDQATPITVGGEDQAMPITEGGEDQATPITEGGEDQATPITVGGKDQAMPINVGGEDQATPINVGGEDQATPINMPGYESESDHNDVTTARRSEDMEVDVMGEGEGRGLEERAPAQTPEQQRGKTTAPERELRTEGREPERARAAEGVEKDGLCSQTGPAGGQGSRGGAEGAGPAGGERDLRPEEEERAEPPPSTPPSCSGWQGAAAVRACGPWDPPAPCQGPTTPATGSWDQDEEEVEVDVLGCFSPAPTAVCLLLESSWAELCHRGAGQCDKEAGLCDREPSEEEEVEVDVIGGADSPAPCIRSRRASSLFSASEGF